MKTILRTQSPDQEKVLPDQEKVLPELIASKSHFDYLDGLRALAALYVVMHHASRYAFDHLLVTQMTLLQKFLFLFFSGGDYAVVLFIVLSGFCLMLPIVRGDGILRGGVLHFFGKRARRIVPPYYFALGFSLFTAWLLMGLKTGTPWDTCTSPTGFDVVTHLLLVQNWFPITAHAVNYPLLTVAIEWQIYFLFPLFVLAWGRVGPIKTVSIVVVSSLVLYEALSKTMLIYAGAQLTAAFGLGMLGAGIAYGRHKRLRSWNTNLHWAAITLCLAVLFWFCAFSGYVHFLGVGLTQCLFGLLAVSLIILTARPGTSVLRRVLSWRPLVRVGFFSYSLYLIHAPLLQIFWQYLLFPHDLSPLATLLILIGFGLPIIVGISYLFSLACERPFLSARAQESVKKVVAHK